MKVASIFAKPYIVRNCMNTRIFKLYILKALGVASLMASGAVFLVLAATFTSSKKQRIRNGYWEDIIDPDKYFPRYNKWLWEMSLRSEPNQSSCRMRLVRSSRERNYQTWQDQTMRYAIVAVESSSALHTTSVINQAKQECDSLSRITDPYIRH
jgi:hypothetical protein